MDRVAGEGEWVKRFGKIRTLRPSGTAASAPFYRFLCLISHSSIVRDHVFKVSGFSFLS
jgi:hypothetical protein